MSPDLRIAIRGLLRNPGFTAVAVLALALGIGANTAIFTVVDSVLLRPLPFHDPSRLVRIGSPDPHDPEMLYSLEDPEYLALARESRTLESVAAFSGGMKNLTGAGDPTTIDTPEVTPSFWKVLGVNPILGRTFAPGEDQAGVISESLWRSRFHADTSILGKSITLDSAKYVVVGVMPADFAYPDRTDAAWIPVKLDPQNTHLASRVVIARLKASVTVERAEAEIDAIARHENPSNPQMLRDPARRSRRAVALRESIVGKIRPALRILLGAVSFLLLIACVNVANLLLARSTRRDQEMAVRRSLGATRLRLIRQMLTEGAVLSILGGALGVILAAWGVAALVSLAPPDMIPRADEIRMDWTVLAFTFALSIASSFLFGLWPAIQTSRNTISESLRKGFGRATSQSFGVRNALIVAEVALALVLLIGAGLMLKSFLKLRVVDPGFRSEHLLTLNVNLSETYRTVDQMNAFHQSALERLRALPGVASAAAVNWLPMAPNLVMGTFSTADRRSTTHFNVTKPGVSPGYFRTMGIPLVEGRDFTDKDTKIAPGVAIVGSSTARRVWGSEDPIGKRITLEDDPTPQDWLTVVGVVDDVKQQDLKQASPPAIYQPLAQVTHDFFLQSMSYVVRTTAPMNVIEGMSRGSLRQVDPDQPILRIATMSDLLVATTAEPRFFSRVLASFSLIALILATLGIYGVISHAVSQRTREIGIRVALGARPRNILFGVLSNSAALVACGIVLGVAGAAALTRVLRSFLFEVTPTDAATFTAVAVLLAVVALAATYIPARRAMQVDPMEALRYE